MSAVVDGLFAVLATMGVVPIIRCPKVSPEDPHRMTTRDKSARLPSGAGD